MSAIQIVYFDSKKFFLFKSILVRPCLQKPPNCMLRVRSLKFLSPPPPFLLVHKAVSIESRAAQIIMQCCQAGKIWK